jgi:hypothetical protein
MCMDSYKFESNHCTVDHLTEKAEYSKHKGVGANAAIATDILGRVRGYHIHNLPGAEGDNPQFQH